MKNNIRNLVLGLALTLASVAAEARQVLELDMRALRSGSAIDIKRELQRSNRYLDLRDAELLAVKVDGIGGRRVASQVELLVDGRSEDRRVLGRNEFDPRFRELDRYNGVLLINQSAGSGWGGGRGGEPGRGGGRGRGDGRDSVGVDDGRGGGRNGGGIVIGEPNGRDQEWLLIADRNARLSRVIVLIEEGRGGHGGYPGGGHGGGYGRRIDLGELKIDKVVGEVARIQANARCVTAVILTARNAPVQIDRVVATSIRDRRGIEIPELRGELRNGEQRFGSLGRRCMDIDTLEISAVSPLIIGPSSKLRVELEVQ